MLGTIVNSLAIIVGGFVGLIMNKRVSERASGHIMCGIALCVLYIGIDGALEGQNVLVVILSMVFGAALGLWIDFDKRLTKLGDFLEKKVSKGEGDGKVARGFVTSSLLFCVGAMAVLGSLRSGISGDHETLFAKSLMDGVSSAVFSATMGVGVLMSGASVFVYQGAITIFAGVLEPLLTEAVIADMTSVGSLLIVGLSFNLLKITDIRLMNYIPAIFMPIIIYMIMGLVGI